MRSLIFIAITAIILSGCGGGSASNSANSGNSKTSNSANASPSPSETKKDTANGKDKEPVTMSISEFMSNTDTSNEGRIVTVTGGNLDTIASDSLLIRDGSGSAFHCYGSFNEYMSTATTIDSLRQKGKSPGAVVKGAFKLDSAYGKPDLSPCVLIDLKK